MFRSILVPIDGSSTSNRGLDEAIGLASDQKAKICPLHVIDELVVREAPVPVLLVRSPLRPRKRRARGG